MKHTAQSGRTMFETLGVLTVMGALSVGSIWVFSGIMNRFRANDLLEEASVRAMRVSEQIKKGGKTLSLGKFLHNETSGGTFSKQVFTEGLSKQFGIQVSNVKKAVCERLLDSITDTSPLRRLALSETPRNPLTQCQDLNSFLMIYNGGFKGESQDTDICDTCLENQTCLTVSGNKKCVSLCPEGETMDEETGVCTNNKCSDNSNCDTSKQFCLLTNSSNGTCTNIGNIHLTSYNNKEYIYNDVNMNWNSAQNWCHANGKELISLSELGCPQIQGSNDCDTYYKSNFSSKFGGHYRWAKEDFWVFSFHTDYGLVRFCEGCSYRVACEK